MPRNRWDLPKHQCDQQRAQAERLKAAGVAIEVPSERSTESVFIDFPYGPGFYVHNVIFDLGPGRLVIVAGVKLMARRSEICLEDCEFSLTWDGPQFSLWGLGDERLDYRVTRDVVFAREEVLNHRLEEGLRLKRDEPVWGLLIAQAFSSQLPPEYSHGAPLTVGLTFIDRAGEACVTTEGEVRVDRKLGSSSRIRLSRKSSGLFDREQSGHEPSSRTDVDAGLRILGRTQASDETGD